MAKDRDADHSRSGRTRPGAGVTSSGWRRRSRAFGAPPSSPSTWRSTLATPSEPSATCWRRSRSSPAEDAQIVLAIKAGQIHQGDQRHPCRPGDADNRRQPRSTSRSTNLAQLQGDLETARVRDQGDSTRPRRGRPSPLTPSGVEGGAKAGEGQVSMRSPVGPGRQQRPGQHDRQRRTGPRSARWYRRFGWCRHRPDGRVRR